jgi:uncharacterized phage-associated protein
MIRTNKNLNRIDSEHVANYIVFKYGPMSHLKLQKLLYYVQGYHLAYFNQPLIEDDFEAWVHGPVSRVLFNKLRGESILYKELEFKLEDGEVSPEVKMKEVLTSDQMELIANVLEAYAKLTGLELENETHSEEPWINARAGYGSADRCDEIIPKDAMKAYFSSLLYEETKN